MKIDFSLYSPQELRDQTEIEFQRSGDAKQAVYNAIAILNQRYGVMEKATQLSIGTKIEAEHKETIKFIKEYIKKHGKLPPEKEVYSQIAKDHLAEFKDYYTRLQAMEKEAEEDMSKAKKDTTKLIKKVIINSRGHQQTVYTLPEGAKTEWLNKFMSFFGFKESRQANQKLEADYKANALDKKGVTWQQWKDHVSEYFNNKDKWDRFFNKNTEQKKETAKKEEQKAKKSEKKPKTAVYKLSLMKFIAGMYGTKPEVKEEPNEENLKENVEKLSNETAKLAKEERNPKTGEMSQKYYDTLKKLNEAKSNLNSFLDKKRTEKINSSEYQEQKKKDEEAQRLREKTKQREREVTSTTYEREKKRNEKQVDTEMSKRISGIAQPSKNNFETMPESEKKEETKPETPEQKAEDKKIAQAINDARPDNRNSIEREITGVTEEEAKQVEIPKIEFKPKSNSVTIPIFQGGNSQVVPVWDYTEATPKDIYLVKEKDILTDKKPAYIPEIDESFFAENKYFIPTVKLGEDKYFVQTHKRRTVYGSSGASVEGNNYYVVVSRDVLASMQDYYLKRAKALKKKEIEDYKTRTGRTPRSGTRISMIAENKMTYPQMSFLQSFTGGGRYDNHAAWVMYKQIRQDLKQKTEDMEIQLEEYENTHAKGRETAYGDKGTKDNLLKDYGVKVKRQNGAEISDEEIGEIKSALDTVYSVFGDRKSMAQNFGLKISHAGDVRMHARKAVGLFSPRMKAIGVSVKFGDKGTGFILAHEWGHFMDYYVGNKNQRHYMSDDPEHVAGQIADTFRKNMAQKQNSKYQTRTCECFARAMEQYWAIKTDNKELMSEWDMGNHPKEETFKEKVMPLIDRFLSENEELLKAFHKEFDSKKKIFIKKINLLTGKNEYRKVR